MSHWDKEDLERLKILYPIIESREELISNFKNRTWRSIQAQGAILGLRKPRLKNSKPCVDDFFFSEWNEKSAYLLGYLEADGYFTFKGNRSIQITFCTSPKDELYLQELANLIGCKKKLLTRTHYNKNGKVYQTKAFVISSRIWKKDLENKYRIGKIPDCITEELLPHYIRGLFDGDGSVYWSKQANSIRTNIVFSSKELAENITNILRLIVKSKLTIYKKTNSNFCWYINLGNKSTKLLYKYLYENANIYLNRKYIKFHQQKG